MVYKKTIILYILIVMSFGSQGEEENEQLVDPAPFKQLIPKRIVYTVPNMDQFTVKKDITYKHIGNTELKMDVYSPGRQGSDDHTAVIFIHGGPVPPTLKTKLKNWGIFESYGQLIAASGFIGITFDYRHYGWDKLIDANSDVNDLISYVRDNANSLGINKNRIILWVFSGGGPLLSHVIRDNPAYIRGMVIYYAALDIQPLRNILPSTIKDELLREYSPIYQLNKQDNKTAPIFIARAGNDNPGINGGIDRFVEEALAKHITIDLNNHINGQHSFDILNDNDRSREIIQRAIDFIKEHGN